MNADITPMNADKAVNDSGSFERVAIAHLSSVGGICLAVHSSAFIGVISAFIGVPRTCPRITPQFIYRRSSA
ncbi:MAG: hypothetical protein AB7P08_17820 [Burkholderiales bacterium]